MYNKFQPQELELISELSTIFGEYRDEFELFSETSPPPTCAGLSTDKKKSAITANKVFAKEIGWGCLIAGKVDPIQEVITFLKLGSPASEEELACAVANWQATVKLPTTGVIDKRTWEVMKLLPKTAYPLSSNVFFAGKRIGILEKSAPYLKCYLENTGGCHSSLTKDSNRGGMQIELGFRITDMNAVRKAGFIDDLGNPKFRWIQAIETNQTLNQLTGKVIKKYSKYVDPNATPGKFDANPYYWNEAGGGITYALVQDYINRPSFSNHLCYDLIFYDRPSRELAEAKTGKRVFWNAEVALVGVRKANKNVLLNSFKWGFDIIINAAGATEIKSNAMTVGPRGGSPTFRKTLNDAIRMGQFPGHCFVGDGFTGKALCP